MRKVARSFAGDGVCKSFLRASGAFFVVALTFFGARAEAQSPVFAKWTETWFPGFQPNFPFAMATDSAGNVIVVGTELDEPIAIKYDTRGNRIWRNYLSSGAVTMGSKAVAVAVDAAGDVFVLSNLRVDISPQRLGIPDTALAKYNAAGVRQWVDFSTENTGGVAVAVTPGGEAYVLTRNSPNGDVVTTKYGTDGSRIWERGETVVQVEIGNGFTVGGPIAIRLDEQGNAYVAANNGLAGEIFRYDPNGNLLNVIGEGKLGVVQGYRVDAAGNSYFLGGAAATQDRIVAKFGAAGALEWLNDLGPETDGQTDPDDTLKDIGVDAAGNVYILQDEASVPATPSGVDMVTTKFSASGAEQWTSRFNSSADHSAVDQATALAVSSAGEAYIAGSAPGPSPIFAQTTTVKYNTAGAQVWVQMLPLQTPGLRPDLQPTGPIAIALGGGGQLFVESVGADAAWLTTDYVQDPAEVEPASLAFGNQGVGTSSAEQTVTLRNAGNAAMTIRTINVTGVYQEFHVGSNCASTLQPGVSCSLFITFTARALGTRSATVIIRDNWPGSATDPTTIAVTGTGVAP